MYVKYKWKNVVLEMNHVFKEVITCLSKTNVKNQQKKNKLEFPITKAYYFD